MTKRHLPQSRAGSRINGQAKSKQVARGMNSILSCPLPAVSAPRTGPIVVAHVMMLVTNPIISPIFFLPKMSAKATNITMSESHAML